MPKDKMTVGKMIIDKMYAARTNVDGMTVDK